MKKIRFPFPISRNDELRGGAGWKRIENAIQQITGRINGLNAITTPEMYGAIGDGITDDTISLQKAIDNNKTVTLSQGHIYKISDSLLLKSDTAIIGNGATIINNAACRTFGKGETPIDNVIIDGVNLIGSGSNDVSGEWPDINSAIVIATKATNITVKNCTFNKFRYGVFIGGEDGQHCYIMNCTFTDCKQAIDTFVEEDGCVTHCIFNDCEVAIELETNDNVTTNNFRISENRVLTTGGDNSVKLHTNINNVTIEGNIFDKAIQTGSTNITDLFIYNNVIGKGSYLGGNFKLCNNIINGITGITATAEAIIFGNYIEAVGTNEDAFETASPNIYFINNTANVARSFLRQGGAKAYIIGLRLLAGSIASNIQWSSIVFYDYCGVATPSDANFNQKLDDTWKYWETPTP